MVRQDQGTGLADLEPLAGRHALLFQLLDLGEQGTGRQDHAVADQTLHAGAQNAGGDQMQDRLLPADDQGMSRIVPALKAHYRTDAIGQEIHQLALALVTPLGADYHYALSVRHVESFRYKVLICHVSSPRSRMRSQPIS